jgi:uncharacterized protein (TIGR02646 family)
VKHIRKRKSPRELEQWRRNNINIVDAQYGTHNFPMAAVRTSLIEEQGGICAYTMIRIEFSSSHTEHLKPQTKSREEGRLAETTDYNNMVACYPHSRVDGEPSIAFGAIYRKSTWDPVKYISPLTASCEAAFKYRPNGDIEASPKSNENAKWMIKALGLGAQELCDLRRSAIENLGLSLAADDPLSALQAKQLLQVICDPDSAGQFRPYCVAIKNAAIEYVQLLEKFRKKRKFIRQSKNRTKKTKK